MKIEMLLSDEELGRYRRQMILRQIGIEGQGRLKASKVLVAGTGGLGSPVALYLAAAGVGTIGLLDNDSVELSNLQRQIIHSTSKLGEAKVVSAKKSIEDLNPNVTVNTHHCKIDKDNAETIIEKYDIIVSAFDNTAARYVANAACMKLNKILIDGAINGFEGYVMPIVPGRTPCYECVYPKNEENTEYAKKEIGVIGCLPGIIGSLQAMETIKYILGIKSRLENKILYYNALGSGFRELKIDHNEECTEVYCCAGKEQLC